MSSTLAVLGSVALRTAEIEDDDLLQQLNNGCDNSALRNGIAAAIEAEQEQMSVEIGKVYLDLRRRQRQAAQEYLNTIRSLRSRITQVKKNWDALDRAMAYGQETMNFVPLAHLLGTTQYDMGLSFDDFQRLRVVPEDWEPSTPAKDSK